MGFTWCIQKYPNITASWQTHWTELSTFFKYPDAVRKLIYTTNPIESLNATIKRKTKSKDSFPTEASAFKVMYLATQEQQNKWNMSSIRNWYEIYALQERYQYQKLPKLNFKDKEFDLALSSHFLFLYSKHFDE